MGYDCGVIVLSTAYQVTFKQAIELRDKLWLSNEMREEISQFIDNGEKSEDDFHDSMEDYFYDRLYEGAQLGDDIYLFSQSAYDSSGNGDRWYVYTGHKKDVQITRTKDEPFLFQVDVSEQTKLRDFITLHNLGSNAIGTIVIPYESC